MEVPFVINFPIECWGYGQLPIINLDTEALGAFIDFKLAVTAHLVEDTVALHSNQFTLPAVPLKSAVQLFSEEHSQRKP